MHKQIRSRSSWKFVRNLNDFRSRFTLVIIVVVVIVSERVRSCGRRGCSKPVYRGLYRVLFARAAQGKPYETK